MRGKRLPGRLITFEGSEGSGKSTLIRALAERLRGQDIELTVTREPGGSPVAEKIREVLLHQSMTPWCELFLYEAARAEHLARTILPALRAGHWVLCDRFTDSSLAYQAHARGLPWEQVKRLNRLATQGLVPDLSVLLDIDPEAGLARASERNRFEDEGVAFQRKVRQGFLKARRERPARWLLVRSDRGTPEQNAEKVLRALLKRLT